jgi:hypothetical protein
MSSEALADRSTMRFRSLWFRGDLLGVTEVQKLWFRVDLPEVYEVQKLWSVRFRSSVKRRGLAGG